MAGFDMSVINYVKMISLEEQRCIPTSKFKTISMEIKSEANDGLIDDEGIQILNGCFFISVYHGLITKGIHTLYDIKLTPLNILLLSEYSEMGSVVDTNKDSHKNMIRELCEILGCKIIFYVGRKISRETWEINPDILTDPYGNGDITIRIVNDGLHFEYIDENDSKFIYIPKSMTKEKAESLQSKIFSSLH